MMICTIATIRRSPICTSGLAPACIRRLAITEGRAKRSAKKGPVRLGRLAGGSRSTCRKIICLDYNHERQYRRTVRL